VVNYVTERYIEECLAENSPLRTAVRQAKFPDAFLGAYGSRLAARPWFIAESDLREFADDLMEFFDLLVSVPQRLFDGDLRRYCAALGIDDRRAALMCRGSTGRPARYGRADVYRDAHSFRLLEFNIGSELGGADRAVMNHALLGVDEFRSFAEEHRLSFMDTGVEVANALRTIVAPVSGDREPVVAMLEGPGGLAKYGNLATAFQEVMKFAGLDVRLGEAQDVTNRNGKIHLDGTPIDMVLRYFSVDQICADPNGEAVLEPFLRAHDAGTTVLYTGMDSGLFANKGALAFLSDPCSRAVFSAAELALIDRVLPWTRALVSGPTQMNDETVDLLDYCRANRDRLILKPRAGFGGVGTVVGWESTDREWSHALVSCADQAYIVQQKVDPQPEPVCDPETGEVDNWIAAWSFFLTEEGYAGSSHIRSIRYGAGSIIGQSAYPPPRTTGVFSFPRERD